MYEKKLLIGLTTCETTIISVNSCPRPVTLINQPYVDLPVSFQATPLLLSCHMPLENIDHIVSILDGLILIGGQDIDPEFYNEINKVEYRSDILGSGSPFLRPQDYQPLAKRDRFEIALYKAAKQKSIPILGICRGLQLINVAEGGTLHQELLEPKIIQHERGSDGWIHHHPIIIDRHSKIYSLLEQETYFMSSLHHQGINKLAPSLYKAAWAQDGLIEIIECIDEQNFIVGVHGHIEQTRQNLKLYDRLLIAFFERARRQRDNFNSRQ